MSTEADNRETLAIRAAFEAFAERLNIELHALNRTELEELDGSKHVHVALLVSDGARTFVVRTEVRFSSDALAVEAALRLAKGARA